MTPAAIDALHKLARPQAESVAAAAIGIILGSRAGRSSSSLT